MDRDENGRCETVNEVVAREAASAAEFFADKRFDGIRRLHTAQEVARQRGTIPQDYTVARDTASAFYARLRELFDQKKSITTFGPYSPGQAVAMKRRGIEGIYLGGWATSAKGSITEDPGPDLASYPLSQVPDEAAPVVRALLTADKNQTFARSRMSEAERRANPATDFRPFIIADADTGHGGEQHVRNLIRRFVEVGVPGYHIEDQKPGVKKCGHQAGKVVVPQDEQNKRLNSARFQLDVMGVPGIIVARTDAESATFLDGNGDERDQGFILGATNLDLPSCKTATLAILRRLNSLGAEEVRGHELYQVSEAAYHRADVWLDGAGVYQQLESDYRKLVAGGETDTEAILDRTMARFLDAWQAEAGLKTYPQAVAEVIAFREEEGAVFELSVEEWLEFAHSVSVDEAAARARKMGINLIWNSEIARTPEGYYQIRGGIECATSRSLHAAPYADLLWMETATANLADARQFAEAIHAVHPDKLLAYNLSPSFNWDTTGMSDDEMRAFPEELGKLGFVFNFITYGGHQVDGLAGEDFATALREDGMLALARLQRKLRLVGSPYRTPQALVGGARLDGALSASTGHTATTKAMGKGSTHVQHLVQTEVPPRLLEEWLELWSEKYGVEEQLRVELRPHVAGSDLLELRVLAESDGGRSKAANVVFAPIRDRHERMILSVRDQNTFDLDLRRRRLMALIHVFLIHRYGAVWVHYVSPTDDNQHQTRRMIELGIFESANTEVGEIIVAAVNRERVRELAEPDRESLTALIEKTEPVPVRAAS
ncbi:MAG: isocitrate lyase ICL2 [Acidobacteria bacterium]|nr:isocitrate lyase ICL2 [Acidobacteriota bacterium]